MSVGIVMAHGIQELTGARSRPLLLLRGVHVARETIQARIVDQMP
jgi:hypothetical protein